MEHTCNKENGGASDLKCYACVEEYKAHYLLYKQVTLKDDFGISYYGKVTRVQWTPRGLDITVEV